jgi:protein-S-isoprenylcysteine O-methyltransferase Ste14
MWFAAKIIIFTILVPGVEAILIPSLLVKGGLFGLIGSAQGWRLLGWLFTGSGIVLYFLAIMAFATKGHGTPAPVDPPKQLVVSGIHSFTRNPMYVAIVSFVIGLAVLSGLWRLVVYSMVLFLFFHSVVVLYEEPLLTMKYGGAYEDYRKMVPRWWCRMRPYSKERQIRA